LKVQHSNLISTSTRILSKDKIPFQFKVKLVVLNRGGSTLSWYKLPLILF